MDGNGDSRPIARHGRRRFIATVPLALWALSILGCSQGPAGHRDPVDLEIERLGGSVLRETRYDGRLIVKVDLSGSAVANDDLAVLKTLGKLECTEPSWYPHHRYWSLAHSRGRQAAQPRS